ncbi:MAG: hypothetical protein AAFP02_10910, partial [Bacteroidota bacterium]
MEKNKLIIALSVFSRKEMTRFKEFAHSPYYNKHRELGLLVDYLEGIYPKFTVKNCDRQRIYQAIYPQQKHHQKQLALLFTYAWRLLEQFLSVDQQRSSVFPQRMGLLRAFRQME